jgi:hypothetical protein
LRRRSVPLSFASGLARLANPSYSGRLFESDSAALS